MYPLLQGSMGKKNLESEVRDAVRDYLQELIGDRSGAGKGMALSANDLMDAAKKGGQKGKLNWLKTA